MRAKGSYNLGTWWNASSSRNHMPLTNAFYFLVGETWQGCTGFNQCAAADWKCYPTERGVFKHWLHYEPCWCSDWWILSSCLAVGSSMNVRISPLCPLWESCQSLLSPEESEWGASMWNVRSTPAHQIATGSLDWGLGRNQQRRWENMEEIH